MSSTTKTQILNACRNLFKVPLFERTLAQITQRSRYGGLISHLPPNSYQYPKGSIRKVRRHGYHYELDISDVMDWFTYFGFWEDKMESLFSLAKEGYTVIDIGANNGLVAFNLATRVGRMGRVISFEPDPETYRRLEKNLSLNDFNQIQLHNLGLGSNCQEVSWSRPRADNAGMNRVATEQKITVNPGIKIPLDSLDNFIQRTCLQRIDLIKIDVEGYEYSVMQGAAKTLERFHPLMFIELSNENLRSFGASAQELLELLENHGYRFRHAVNARPLSSRSDFVSPHSQDYCGGDTYYDIIGIPFKPDNTVGALR